MKRTEVLSCIAIITAFLLPGCGTTTGDPSSSKLLASQECMGCHSTSTSHVTNASIVAEWTASAHNTGDGASCADCHEPAAGHPNNCSRCHGGGAPTGTADHDVRLNPDSDGICMSKCHGRGATQARLGTYSATGFSTRKTFREHFSNRSASFVSSQNLGLCRRCHNPHNPTATADISRQWAQSLHGDHNQPAWRSDFKTRGTPVPAATNVGSFCVRCHTATGFVNFVTSGYNDQHAWGVSGDPTKEVLGCYACHDDGQGNAYSWKRRSIPPVMIYYNVSTGTSTRKGVKITGDSSRTVYPDAGPSNLCIACHSGRGGVGREIYIAAGFLNFSNASNIPSGHNLVSALIMYKTGGYEYTGRDYSNPPAYLHDRIGLNNTVRTGESGPCAACHMTSSSSHSWKTLTFDTTTKLTATAITAQICANCHNGGSASGTTLPAWTAADIQTRRDGYHAALASLNTLITARRLSTTNWAKYGKAGGANMMGASYNYSMLLLDDGAYVHNDVYTKRLIYDSIDWVNDGQMNNDVEAAINGITFAANLKDPITGVVYTAAQVAALKGVAINYLIGGPGGQRP